MITITSDEYAENDIAYNITRVYILGILIYSKITTTTNINIVKVFTSSKKVTKVEGFKRYEN